MKSMHVKLTFVEPVLGSSPNSQEVLRKYIASKSENPSKMEEEADAIKEEDEEETVTRTVFPRLDDGTPFLWDYQVKGFFKSACQALNMASPSTKLSAFKKKIDLLVFVDERKSPYILPEDSEMGILTRPLRAATAKGERIALAESEMIPAGTTVEFTITTLEDDLLKRVKDWLDYGRFNGLGQWRNAKYGSFTWELVE